jgi:hypothetical protein
MLFLTTEAATAWAHHRMMQARTLSPAATRKALDPKDTTLA